MHLAHWLTAAKYLIIMLCLKELSHWRLVDSWAQTRVELSLSVQLIHFTAMTRVKLINFVTTIQVKSLITVTMLFIVYLLIFPRGLL